jgi:hypothetical protein
MCLKSIHKGHPLKKINTKISAGLEELWFNGVMLFAMGVGLLLIAAKRFRTMTV